MKRAISIFAICATAACLAAVNPLGAGIAGYTYTKPAFTVCLEGRIIGYGMDYRAFRMEDLYFLAEALGERTYTLNLQWNLTNDYFMANLCAYPSKSNARLGYVDLTRFAPQSYNRLASIYATTNPPPIHVTATGFVANVDAPQYLAATHAPGSIITSDKVNFPLKRFPSLSDLTNTYTRLDMARCVFSPVFDHADSNRTTCVYTHYSTIDGAPDSTVWTNISDSGMNSFNASTEKAYDWFRFTEEDEWEMVEEHSYEDWDIVSSFNGVNMNSGLGGLMFAATVTPRRVKSGVAVTRFAFSIEDYTWRNGDTLSMERSTNSVLLQCALHETNGFFYVDIPRSKMEEAMTLCDVWYPSTENVPLPSVDIKPSGGHGAQSVTFGHVRNLNIQTDVLMYFYDTNFKTTLKKFNETTGGN